MDDVALYDLPPLMALAQRLSGERRLFFVGYSAGGHSLYVLMHLRPDLRDSFRAAFLLAPSVVFTGRHSPAVKAISNMPDRALRLMAENANEMVGRSPGFVRLVGEVCGVNASKQMRAVCISVAQALFNLNAKKMDIKNLDFALAHGICGTSSMAVAHYVQMVKSKKLQAFDWGPKENLHQYGTEKPPEHLLQNITLPIALFIGRGDTQVAVEDTQTLGRKSSRNLGVFVIPDEDWDHFDYITNRRAPRLIYDRILAMLPDF